MEAGELCKLFGFLLLPPRDRDEKRACPAQLLAQLPRYLDTAHIGHSEVEQHDIRLIAANEVYDGVAAIHLEDRVSVLLQQRR